MQILKFIFFMNRFFDEIVFLLQGFVSQIHVFFFYLIYHLLYSGFDFINNWV